MNKLKTYELSLYRITNVPFNLVYMNVCIWKVWYLWQRAPYLAPARAPLPLFSNPTSHSADLTTVCNACACDDYCLCFSTGIETRRLWVHASVYPAVLQPAHSSQTARAHIPLPAWWKDACLLGPKRQEEGWWREMERWQRWRERREVGKIMSWAW